MGLPNEIRPHGEQLLDNCTQLLRLAMATLREMVRAFDLI